MNEQMSFTELEYSKRKRKSKNEIFLERMDRLIPWDEWVEIVDPYYKRSTRSRRPVRVEVLLKMRFLRIWFDLSDAGVEDAVFDSYAMKKFLGIDFDRDRIPDATTLSKFRHALDKAGVFDLIDAKLENIMRSAKLSVRRGKAVSPRALRRPSSKKR